MYRQQMDHRYNFSGICKLAYDLQHDNWRYCRKYHPHKGLCNVHQCKTSGWHTLRLINILVYSSVGCQHNWACTGKYSSFHLIDIRNSGRTVSLYTDEQMVALQNFNEISSNISMIFSFHICMKLNRSYT